MSEEEVQNQEVSEEQQNNTETQEEEVSISKQEYEAMKSKLASFENKDFNFKALREKKLAALSEEEKEVLHKKTLEVVEKSKEIEESQKKFIEKQQDEYKEDALDAIAGDDKEKREKILFHYNRLGDKADTKREIIAKMRDAYKLASGSSHSVTESVASAAGTYWGVTPKTKERENFAEKSDGKKLLETMGIKLSSKSDKK